MSIKIPSFSRGPNKGEGVGAACLRVSTTAR